MKKISMFIVVIIVFFSAQAKADEMTKTDWILEGTWEILHAFDWGTTRDIADKPDRYYEVNPSIGKHPDKGRVDAYMAATAILHPIVTRLLPKRGEIFGFEFNPRATWQMVSIGVSTTCVVNNFSIGLTVNLN